MRVLTCSFDFTDAAAELERALAQPPGIPIVQQTYAVFAAWLGRRDTGIAAGRRAVAPDPLNPPSHSAGEAPICHLAAVIWQGQENSQCRSTHSPTLPFRLS